MASNPLRDGAVEVVRALRDAGFEAWWAGGCVRDRLMGLTPKDYDVATDARPEQVMTLFDRTVPVGVQFGVVRVLLGEREYEVATFRAEAEYSDGRHPDGVAWSSAREDVLRRDFTINGLLYDPLGDVLADHVGGRRDLAAGLVRAIGDPHRRFAEDRLRGVRAVRFAARFGFAIEEATWAAVGSHASEISVVSPERLGVELERILCEGGGATGLRLLAESGLLERILPELVEAERAARRFEGAGVLAPERAWALALLEVPAMPAEARETGRRLRLSNARWEGFGRLIEVARAVEGYGDLSVSARKRLLREESAAEGLAVAERAVLAGQQDGAGLTRAGADLARWTEADLRPARLLSGDDLAALGLEPGPRFGEVLEAIEDAQLEARIGTREEAEALALSLAEASER